MLSVDGSGIASPADAYCGPACRAVIDRRVAVANTAQPGDDYYEPVNDLQRNAHRQFDARWGAMARAKVSEKG